MQIDDTLKKMPYCNENWLTDPIAHATVSAVMTIDNLSGNKDGYLIIIDNLLRIMNNNEKKELEIK